MSPQRQHEAHRRDDKQEMQDQRWQANGGQKNEEEHGNVALSQLDQEKREFVSEKKQTRPRHQLSMTRIKRFA